MRVAELKSGIEVRDSVFSPLSPAGPAEARVIRFRKGDKHPLYKVWIYLDGVRVPFVDRVTYALHSSFRDPLRTVARSPSNPNCALELWTWGIFDVGVTIWEKSGERSELVHRLTYDRDFDRSDVRFVEESEYERGA